MPNYNVKKMITSGREIMARNPKRELSVIDFTVIRDLDPELYAQMENAFLFGVALGARISKAEQTKRR